MQIIDTRVVRGPNQPSITVEFLGEGGESVEVNMRDEALSSLSEAELVERARALMVQISTFDADQAAASMAQHGQHEDAGADQTLSNP